MAEICREQLISQSLFYRWRVRFLEAGQKALINGANKDETEALRAQIEKLEKTILRQRIAIEALKNPVVNLREAVKQRLEKGVSVKSTPETLAISRGSLYRGTARKMKTFGPE
ncbi:MAG: hypothetical protein QME85_03925 [Candidatus Saccharicenans sp.]|nr:hypothetical protein [Candidatus Saccharicenans sp.]